MPNQRLLMRQIREVLRHKYALGLSEREIGRALGISKSGVGDAIRRARSCDLTWPLPDDLTDHALERRLFPSVEGLPTRFVNSCSIADQMRNIRLLSSAGVLAEEGEGLLCR